MGKAIGWSLFSIVLLALIGAAAGYMTLPRYQAPANSGETRLRERAEAYYRALQVKDFATIVTSYTPARQLAEREELAKTAAHELQVFSRFEPATQQKLRDSSLTIKAAELEVQLEGDWAVTQGSVTVHPLENEPEKTVQIPIGEVVWLRNGGDWWVYQRQNSELLAYGNPPDFALQLLQKQSQGINSAGAIDLETLQPGEPAGNEGGAEEPGDAADTSAPAETEDDAPPADNQDDGAVDE